MIASIYWIDNHNSSGRLAVLARPRGDEWLESEIQSWRDAGIDVVVSLLTASEVADLGLKDEGQFCSQYEIEFRNFPIEDCSVPESRTETLELVRSCHELLSSGKNIGFHCRGGLGRSPLIASCVLMLSGKSAEEAYQTVGAARGLRVPETPEQAVWGKRLKQELSSTTN